MIHRCSPSSTRTSTCGPWPRPCTGARPGPSYQRQLAWALQAHPGLLTGDGHLAPLRAIPRLIDLLHDGRCRRNRPPDLSGLSAGRAHRQAAGRGAGLPDLHRALPHSRSARAAAPAANRSPATRMVGRSAPTASSPTRRTWRPASTAGAAARSNANPGRAAVPGVPHAPGPDLLDLRRDDTLRHLPRHRPALVSGLPTPVRRVLGLRPPRERSSPAPWPTRSAPTAPPPPIWRDCPTCSDPNHPHPGQCGRCLINSRLDELMGPDTDCLPPGLQALRENISTAEHPITAMRWLTKPAVAPVLADLAAGARRSPIRRSTNWPTARPWRICAKYSSPSVPCPNATRHMVRTRALPGRSPRLPARP